MKNLHNWNLSYSQAIKLQAQLAHKVKFTPLQKSPKLIAGLDCAFSKDGLRIIGAAVVLEPPNFELIETAHAILKIKFPYIPGLLSFREAPALLAAVEKLKSMPQLFIVDGQGIAHPRRLGLAAHIGLFLDKPTIGCAKSRLTGSFNPPQIENGDYSYLTKGDETIGAVVRTRTNVKPVFVSVGNRCTLTDAIKWALKCSVKYRLPEPVRLAHNTVSKLKA